jgi:hypothetical protein
MGWSRGRSGALTALALVILVATLGVAPVARAQGVALGHVRVTNNSEGWGEVQGAFDPHQHVSIFVHFATGQHGGFSFSGVCVLSLAATGQELYRVAIPPMWIQPGWEQYRTSSFQMSWPQAAVTVTCVPDYNRALALAVTLQPHLFTGGGGQGWGPGAPVPVPEPEPEPDGTEACRARVLERGWSPSNLGYCDGVEETCALVLLERGWSPSGLPDCVGVDGSCARALLERGWAPSGLGGCSRGVELTCASELLERGWSPSELRHCRGVEPGCATQVLQQGYAPSNLSNCTR